MKLGAAATICSLVVISVGQAEAAPPQTFQGKALFGSLMMANGIQCDVYISPAENGSPREDVLAVMTLPDGKQAIGPVNAPSFPWEYEWNPLNKTTFARNMCSEFDDELRQRGMIARQ